jgi:DNA polymerase III subunit gamma/tau
MSLYLKYRPKSFADVVGQDHIVTTLEHAIKRDQLVHAYLFFGPRGTGKTSVARILAKILLIQGLKDESVQKQVIKSVDEGTLVDLIEIDAATNRQIDDVRDLKEKVQFAPSVASAKVYIIDEVHMMTKEAFNALLKTLEEPPPHTYFILATTELHKVPDTIQSRCQRFPFHLVGDDDIVRCLQNIADKEHINIDRGALRAIARHVNGGVRDAISLLDQLSSLEEVTESDVRLRIGESAEEYVENIWGMLDEGDHKAALDIVSTLQEKGVSLEVFLRQLLARARKDLHERIDSNDTTAPAIERIDTIFQALKDLRVSPVPAVALEVAIVDLCIRTDAETLKPLKKKEKKIEKGTKTEKISKDAKEEEQSDADATGLVRSVQKKDATFVAVQMTREEIMAAWNDILALVKTASIRMSLKDAHIESFEDNCVTLAFASGFHRDKVMTVAASHEVEAALKEHFQQVVRIHCTLRGEGASLTEDSGEETVNMADAVKEIFGR